VRKHEGVFIFARWQLPHILKCFPRTVVGAGIRILMPTPATSLSLLRENSLLVIFL
jgi:hypothetical protein